MLRLLCIALSLFLSLQLAVADPAPTVLRVSRHSKTSALVTKSVLSALLVRRGKYLARASNGVCPSGYQQCTNYPDSCAPTGNYCCNDLYNCPNDSTCFDSECCPNTAQTCNGNACCSASSECCTDESCCEPGLFCCNDSIGGCCPTGSTCIANTDQCSTDGGSGSGGSGGGSGGTTVTTATPSKSTAPLGTTSSNNVITFNGPTTTGSSSTHSSTVSSGGSTASGITSTGAASRVAPGTQLAALAAVVGLPILHNVLHAL